MYRNEAIRIVTGKVNQWREVSVPVLTHDAINRNLQVLGTVFPQHWSPSRWKSKCEHEKHLMGCRHMTASRMERHEFAHLGQQYKVTVAHRSAKSSSAGLSRRSFYNVGAAWCARAKLLQMTIESELHSQSRSVSHLPIRKVVGSDGTHVTC